MNVIEPARTSRSRCRHCRKQIEEGDLRFGSDHEGMYADGAEAYGWFHLRCAAQRLPEALREVLKRVKKPGEIPDYDKLVATCDLSLKKSASRYPYGERAPSGRARCIRCDQPIGKGELRVAVEREIVTGTFATVGAGYLHPACAVAHLADPTLPAQLRAQSPLLSKADLDALVTACEAAAVDHPVENVAKVEAPAARAPRVDDRTAELVFADALVEQGDPRGEAIVVESQLRELATDDPRRPDLSRRAQELLPKATAKWHEELGVPRGSLVFDRGVPVGAKVALARNKLPEKLLACPWLHELVVTDASEESLATLLQHPQFPRIRSLSLTRVTFTWDGFRGFCACNEVASLESLQLTVNLGLRAALLLLSSTRFTRLERLDLGTSYSLDPDLRPLDRVNGLPALRRLAIAIGFTPAVLARLLRSPLGQRIEELEPRWFQEELLAEPLPRLKKLVVGGGYMSPQFGKVLARAKLPALETLVAAGVHVTDAAILPLVSPLVLPKLRTLDVRNNPLGPATLDQLRARFGEGLVADPAPAPKKVAKKAAKKATKKATKKAAAKKGAVGGTKKAGSKKAATKKAATKKSARR